jgi:hypothetical protein
VPLTRLIWNMKSKYLTRYIYPNLRGFAGKILRQRTPVGFLAIVSCHRDRGLTGRLLAFLFCSLFGFVEKPCLLRFVRHFVGLGEVSIRVSVTSSLCFCGISAGMLGRTSHML